MENFSQGGGGQANQPKVKLSVKASLGSSNPSNPGSSNNMFQSFSYSKDQQQAPRPNIDLTNTQHGAAQPQHSTQEQPGSKKPSPQTQRLQGLGHSKTPGKPGAPRPAGAGLQQSTGSGLPLRGSFSKLGPEERQHAAQQSLQQRQQREREEQQQQQPAKRQRKVVMESDEESEEDAAAKDKEEAQRRGKSLMLRVEEISEKLRAMLGGGSANDRYAAVSEDQQAAAAASGGSALVRREQIQAACGTDAASTLKGYQLVGINFLMVLSRSGSAEGAILADEMGLGKTAQTICFLGLLQHIALQQWQQQQQQHQGNPAELRKLKGPKPHLIICPSSLLENWERELKQWCPKLRILTYYGKERSEARTLLENWQTQANAARKNPFAQKAAASSANGKSFQGLEGSSEEEEEAHEAGEDEVLEDAAAEGSEDEDAAVLGFKLPDPANGAAAPFDILLSTYSMFERDSMDAKVDRSFIKRWAWSHLVADEAHALKNSTSIRHQRMMKIAQDCDHRILLTGTPLQNDLGELLALLRFLMPSLFGSSLEMDDEDILGTELQDKAQDEQAQAGMADRMRRLLAPFILRRLKSEVAGQLVPKVQELREVEMVPEQKEVYTKAIQNMRAEVAAARAGKKTDKSSSFEGVDKSLIGVTGPRGSKPSSQDKEASVDQAGEQSAPSTSGSNAGTLVSKLGGTRISNLFTHLRKIALHPLLVRHRYTDEKVQAMAKIATSMQLFGGQCTYDRVLKEMITWSDHALHGFSVTNARHLGSFALPQEALLASAKLKVLSELLPELLAKGNKVLLFSQWTQVLDVLEWFMHRHGFKYVRLDGNTNVQDRLTIVDTFNNPENGVFVFLLSTRAGGQGLNLTGADTVILHDVDFNPQTDKQAEDRCHRLGQERPVTVLRLVTKDTVDRNIVDIAERKLRLDAAIMDGVTLGAKQGDAGNANGEDAEGSNSKAAKGKGKGEGEERKHMGMILAQLLAQE